MHLVQFIDQDNESDCILGRAGIEEIQCALPNILPEVLGVVRISTVSLERSHREWHTREASCQEFSPLFSPRTAFIQGRQLLSLPFLQGRHLFEGSDYRANMVVFF